MFSWSDVKDISWCDVKMTTFFKCFLAMNWSWKLYKLCFNKPKVCENPCNVSSDWKEEHQWQSLTSPHQTIPLLPPQGIPSIFTYCSLLSLFSTIFYLHVFSVTLPQFYFPSFLIIFNLYLFFYLPSSFPVIAVLLSFRACSTPSPWNRKRGKYCSWRSRQRGGHTSPVPTGKLSYKFSSFSFFYSLCG